MKLLNDEIVVPFQTYFALGKRPLPESVVEKLKANNGQVCENLFVMGRNFFTKTFEGVKVVAIGGAHTSQDDTSLPEYAPFHTEADITRAKEYRDTDILITTDWPEGMRNGSRAATSYTAGEAPFGDRSIADLCAALKPRYHFSAGKCLFEREPFFHAGDTPLPITRFLSLPPYGNEYKQKWIYAFNIGPSAPAPQELPAGCTASPFTSLKKRKLPSQEDSYNGFRFATEQNTSYNGSDDRYRPSGARGGGRHNKKRRTDCYFCLGGEGFETHMVGSIGEEVFLTTSKGPLTTSANFPDLAMHSHMLIIPLPHVATFQAMKVKDGEAATVSCRKEMERYKESLQTMVSAKSTKGTGDATLGAVTYEISRASGVHLHWQFLPVPVDMIKKGLVEAAFDVEAENLKYGAFAKDEAAIKTAEEGDYFKVMIWSEAGEKTVVLPLEPEMRFDLQFGRGVLGKLLGLEKRRHWKDCGQSVEEESADAEAFKGMFEQYDFNMLEGEGNEQSGV